MKTNEIQNLTTLEFLHMYDNEGRIIETRLLENNQVESVEKYDIFGNVIFRNGKDIKIELVLLMSTHDFYKSVPRYKLESYRLRGINVFFNEIDNLTIMEILENNKTVFRYEYVYDIRNNLKYITIIKY